jgi:hypothetical protein
MNKRESPDMKPEDVGDEAEMSSFVIPALERLVDLRRRQRRARAEFSCISSVVSCLIRPAGSIAEHEVARRMCAAVKTFRDLFSV